VKTPNFYIVFFSHLVTNSSHYTHDLNSKSTCNIISSSISTWSYALHVWAVRLFHGAWKQLWKQTLQFFQLIMNKLFNIYSQICAFKIILTFCCMWSLIDSKTGWIWQRSHIRRKQCDSKFVIYIYIYYVFISYRVTFGMYQVNYSNPNTTRIPKSSAYAFSEITRNRNLPVQYLQITREISENATDSYNSQNRNSTPHHSAANCKGIFFNYTGFYFYVWLATVIYSGHIFIS
jgi:hypothetical protein